MICIHHNKDMDGYSSGAIVRLKYPDVKLTGWDYKDEIPELGQFKGEDVIMIDITFPLEKLLALSHITNSLLVIDHHISFKKEYDKFIEGSNKFKDFTYIYEDRIAACEIGWKYLFPDKPIPLAVTLMGRYDTWRQEEGDWAKETLPFKYYMYGQCNSTEGFPTWVLDSESDLFIYECVNSGIDIMKYQDMMDEAATRAYSFEREVYGLRGLVLNIPYFNSESLKTKYNPDLHDIMVGFVFTGTKWSVSLRSAKPDVDVSIIAKARGGGGHKGAAGFEVKTFEEIFI